MAQSLHIGLYGFSTNLPFGIYAIYLLPTQEIAGLVKGL